MMGSSCSILFPLKIRGTRGVMKLENNSPSPSYFKRGILLIGLAILWFLLAQKIISLYSPSGSYQFLSYYQWLVDASFADIARHIFSFSNINLIVAALLPFLFLPLLKPTWLLLTLPSALIGLLSSTGGSVVWQTHLIALWLPGLIVAAASGYAKVIGRIQEKKLHAWVVPVGLFITVIASGRVMGPSLLSPPYQGVGCRRASSGCPGHEARGGLGVLRVVPETPPNLPLVRGG